VIHVVENDQGGDPEFGTPDGLGFGEMSEAFVLGARMGAVAMSLNGLDRSSRELLVLYHIERTDWRDLDELHRVPRTQMAGVLLATESAFVAKLHGRGGWDHPIEPDVHGPLIDLAEGLLPLEPDQLAAFILLWLAEHGW
jgi:hypothetical protein